MTEPQNSSGAGAAWTAVRVAATLVFGTGVIFGTGVVQFNLDHEFSADMIGFRFYPVTLVGAVAATGISRALLRVRTSRWILAALGAFFVLLPALMTGFLFLAGCAMSGGGCQGTWWWPYLTPMILGTVLGLTWVTWRVRRDTAQSRLP